MATNPTTRFTSRVRDYVLYRPSYPLPVVELLKRECGLENGAAVADIGAGTGIFSKLLLEAGLNVFAVEPNDAMREAAEAELDEIPGFHSVAATSEATELDEASVDLVVAAQAFHWFDRAVALQEFRRILHSPKWVALIWNNRIETGSPFLEGYETILRTYATDYLKVRHNEIEPDDLAAWFGGGMNTATFPNAQRFDFTGVEGRLMSSSYAPRADDERHAPMMAALRDLFDHTAENGAVEFRYETQVFYGVLD
jgi:SAM-dependent methyltransferase